MKYMLFFGRWLAYVLFALFFAFGWKLVNAQASQTICRPVGQAIVCDTVQNPFQPVPGFDASVIGRIPDGAQLSPETIHHLWFQQCVRVAAQEGLTPEQIRARCLR